MTPETTMTLRGIPVTTINAVPVDSYIYCQSSGAVVQVVRRRGTTTWLRVTVAGKTSYATGYEFDITLPFDNHRLAGYYWIDDASVIAAKLHGELFPSGLTVKP